MVQIIYTHVIKCKNDFKKPPSGAYEFLLVNKTQLQCLFENRTKTHHVFERYPVLFLLFKLLSMTVGKMVN